MYNLAGAIITIGFAIVSVAAFVFSEGSAGGGWGVLSFLTLLFWDWKRE